MVGRGCQRTVLRTGEATNSKARQSAGLESFCCLDYITGENPGKSLRPGSGDHELAEQVRDKSLGIPFRDRMQRKAGGQLWVRLQLGQVLWGWNRS